MVVAFASLGVVSCGTPAPRCNSTTCSTGCCDLSGICQSGNSTGACGSRGNTCTACGLGASCSFGTCLGSTGAGSSGTGGGTSGTGGGTSGTGGGTSGGSTGTGGGSTGTGGGISGTGGGISGTGGGISGTGGGISGTGGGISGTGGGISGTGGGISGTGGGISGTGGGISGTGGGISGTGGGTSGTGGGSPASCDIATSPSCPVGTACVISGATSTAGLCLPGDCDVSTQNCIGQNKCVVSGTADGGIRRICVPSGTSTLPPGASCSASSDQCQAGSQCVPLSGQSLCRQFCGPMSSPCVSGTICNVLIQFGTAPGGERQLICVAPPACDPLNQSSCASNLTCLFFAAGAPAGCLQFGTVPVGGSCSGTNLCQRGLQCVGSGSAGVCRAFCSTTGTPGCATGTCQPSSMGTVGTCQ